MRIIKSLLVNSIACCGVNYSLACILILRLCDWVSNTELILHRGFHGASCKLPYLQLAAYAVCTVSFQFLLHDAYVPGLKKYVHLT